MIFTVLVVIIVARFCSMKTVLLSFPAIKTPCEFQLNFSLTHKKVFSLGVNLSWNFFVEWNEHLERAAVDKLIKIIRDFKHLIMMGDEHQYGRRHIV